MAGNLTRVLVTANPDAGIGFLGNCVSQVRSKSSKEDTVIYFLYFLLFSYFEYYKKANFINQNESSVSRIFLGFFLSQQFERLFE